MLQYQSVYLLCCVKGGIVNILLWFQIGTFPRWPEILWWFGDGALNRCSPRTLSVLNSALLWLLSYRDLKCFKVKSWYISYTSVNCVTLPIFCPCILQTHTTVILLFNIYFLFLDIQNVASSYFGIAAFFYQRCTFGITLLWALSIRCS